MTSSQPDTRVPREDAAWHVFLYFQVPDAVTQQAFIDAYRPVVDEHVAGWPGFLGATLFTSSDGTRVINHTRWVDEAAYQHFLDVSNADERLRAIQAAFARVPGITGPDMTMTHTYTPEVTITGAPTEAAAPGARPDPTVPGTPADVAATADGAD